jgi:DNA polymerase
MVRGHAIVPTFGKCVTDVLKGMLRPALIPTAGNSLVVADWSGIEARVNPWLSISDAGIQKLSLFARGEDVYKVNAAATFHVPASEVTSDQRQIGKVQELACFTAETKVLTDNGVKAIVGVLLTDKLWDGEKWVQHQGVIYKGRQKVIQGLGFRVTAGHLLRVKQDWVDAKTVLSNPSILISALVTGSVNLPFWVTKQRKSAYVLNDWLKFNALVMVSRTMSAFITCLKAHLRGATFAPRNRQGFGAKIFSSTPMLAPMMHTAGDCLIGFPLANNDATTQKIKTTETMVGGGYTYMNLGEQIRQHFYAMLFNLKGGINRIWNWIGSTSIKDMSLTICVLLLNEIIVITSGLCKKCKITFSNLKPVYDILNSGDLNRFTIVCDDGYLIAHNCGFAGGVGAFAAMGRAYGILLPEPQAKRMVAAWRLANPWATPYWQNLEEAYTRAMRNKGHEFTAGRVCYMYDGQHLWYALPSGRVLCYPFAKLEADGITYAKAAWKPAADAKEWPRARLWKGLACENITQAVANDLLRHSLRQFEEVGLATILHIHDECVVECQTESAEEVMQQMEKIMCTAPDWAKGIPLGVESSIMQRYGK